MTSYMLWQIGFKCKNGIKKFLTKEDGDVNVVAIVVLIGVAVLLAILFKDQISNLMKKLIEAITGNADEAINQRIE